MEDDIVLRVLGRGDAHRALGDRPAARDAWPGVLAVLDDLHHPHAGQVGSRWEDLPVRH